MCNLASTGSDAGALIVVAVALLLAGAVSVFATRRRAVFFVILMIVAGAGIAVTSTPVGATAACTPGVTSAALAIDKASWNAGSTTSSQTFTITNISGSTVALGVVAGLTGDPDFTITSTTCSGSVAPVATCVVNAAFAPTTSGTRVATLTVAGSNTNSLSVPFNASVPNVAVLDLSPASDTLGPLSGNSTFTLTNTSTLGTGVGLAVSISGDSSFAIGANSCASTLAPLASCAIEVVFTQGGPGTVTGTLGAQGTNTNSVSSGLDATVPSTTGITLSPLSHFYANFGETQTFTVSNVGVIPVLGLVVSLVPDAHTGVYIRTGGTCATTIASGATCTIDIQYIGFGGPTSWTLSVAGTNSNTAGATLTALGS